MNPKNPDDLWKNLLSQSAPTFAPDAEPPYGFMTAMLAALRARQQQQHEFERIGVRALMASFVALGVTAVVALALHPADRGDFDPGVRSLVQVDNLPYS